MWEASRADISRFGGVEGQINSGSGNGALGEDDEGGLLNDGERNTGSALAKREREDQNVQRCP
jgi:hypothetical protein